MSIKTICKMMATMAFAGRVAASDVAAVVVDTGGTIVDHAMDKYDADREPFDDIHSNTVNDATDSEEDEAPKVIQATHAPIEDDPRDDYENVFDEEVEENTEKDRKSPESGEKPQKTS